MGSGILKAAGVMSAATLISRVLGLVREQVFAYFFGAGNITDAFNIAFRIPNLFRDLFAEGAMSASVVPTFTRTRIQEGDRRAWRVAGLVFRILFFLVLALSVLGIYYSPELASLYASGYKKIPGKYELTVQMTQIMFPFFPFVALAAAFMGILNACGVFFIPALASALFNLVSILVGVSLVFILRDHANTWGIQPIIGMAIGVLAGGIVQAFCQLPSLYKAGYRWPGKAVQDPPWWKDPALKQILWMMLPGTIGLAATQVNLLINSILATGQGPGAVSWLNYAFRLMQFPIGVFGVSIAAATLPKLSSHWVKKEALEVEKTLLTSLKTVFAVNLPASAGLAFLGGPIIELLFQYGHFYMEDVNATALALSMYAVGLTAYSAVKVLVPACYALGNTRVAVISSCLAVAVTIVLNLIMIKPFGYWGLALGTSLAAIFNAVFLLLAVQKLITEKGGRFRVISLVPSLFKYSGVSIGMGLVCFLSQFFLLDILPTPPFIAWFGTPGLVLVRILRVMILVCEGLGFIWVASRTFELPEVTEVTDLFLRKFKNKLRLEK